MSEQTASLNPENFVEGGGLIDDVDVTFKECIFDMFDYNGKVVPGVPSLKITMGMEDDEEAVQYYSVGSANDWIPSEDHLREVRGRTPSDLSRAQGSARRPGAGPASRK